MIYSDEMIREADLVVIQGIIFKNRFGQTGGKIDMPDGCYSVRLISLPVRLISLPEAKNGEA